MFTPVTRRRPAKWALPLLLGVWLLPAAPAQARLDYEVRSGDTLSGIAARHGVSVSAVVSQNDLTDPDLVVAGTVLIIPTAGATTQSGGSVTHVVQPGETLSQIAARAGVTVAQLAAANGIANPDRIVQGQRLRVAGASGAPATPATSSSPASAQPATGRDGVRQLITAAAQRHGWRPAVPLGLAMQESGWNNSVVSSAGALGIMQVLPATADWVGLRLGRRLDPAIATDNVAAGMYYLDHLYGRFDGNVEWALAAYFEGPERVARNGGPSSGAQRYVDNVLALAARYR